MSHPAKRKTYDRTFDSFSYKKEVYLAPYQLLQKIKELKIRTSQLDPHRMDLDRLEFEITELLSERNINTLERTEEKLLVQQFIAEVLETARPLSPGQLKPIGEHLLPLADDITKEKMKAILNAHTWNKRWNTYKIVFALAGGILLCLLIYLLSRPGQ